MRAALANANADLVKENNKYVMQITGDNEEGKRELDNFINPSEKYPVIAVTSKLMTTGVDAQTCKLIVLDSNIGSPTEFKQIIGRGTRINEEYGKTYFTIMDFRNVTNHFADPDFDGDPVSIIDIDGDGPIVLPEPDEPVIIDDPDFPEPDYPEPDDPDVINEPKTKYIKKIIQGVDVKIINERIQYLGADGKIITESLIDYTKKSIGKEYKTLDSFLQAWNNADKKKVIIDELEEKGIFFDALNDEVGKQFDPFDLVCHIAFEMPALSRKDRADSVKKRNYFAKYSEKAQIILSNLLDKYADDGLITIESTEVLKLKPINELGTPVELIKAFGGKSQYEMAIRELEQELYKKA
jgi:type I restriction enzyme R subunit